MRAAIIECFQNSEGAKQGTSILAHIKNGKIIAHYLGIPYFISPADLGYAAVQKFDTLIFTASSRFAEHEHIKRIIANNKDARFIYISNDYNTTPHSELNKYGFETICAYETGERDTYFLNLNALMAKKPLKQIPKKYDCLYWGSFREGREKDFKRYLHSGVYLSTMNKSQKYFTAAGCTPNFVQKIDWNKSIASLFRYSLYIEDEETHSNFCNLANRWYEAGTYNMVTFFDKKCRRTIERSEIAKVYDDFYTVDSYETLMKRVLECNKDFQKHLKQQQEWHKLDFVAKEKTLEQIRQIVMR